MTSIFSLYDQYPIGADIGIAVILFDAGIAILVNNTGATILNPFNCVFNVFGPISLCFLTINGTDRRSFMLVFSSWDLDLIPEY
jgi:hypothetical protein